MKMNDIVKAIDNSPSVALITHINPDGDAIGSTLALMHALDKIGKLVDVYCQDDIPNTFYFLNGISRIIKPDQSIKKYDLVIALDCNDPERMGSCSVIMDKAIISANIDHHISNTLYSDINVVDGDASATGEIVYELINLLEIIPDKDIAEALYTAIVSDTGRFSYSNTTPKTHRVVATLIEWGADIDKLSNLLFKNHSLEWIKLLGQAINSLRIYHDGKVAIMHITKEMMAKAGATEEHSNGIIQYAKDISGVELAAVLREVDDSTIKVSLRSQSIVDVSVLAKKFGGGGHRRASGCTINLPLIQAQENLMKAIDLYFEE